MKTNFPPVMSATGTTCPAVTAMPRPSMCRRLGNVATFYSRLMVFAGVLWGSVNPKSADANTHGLVLQRRHCFRRADRRLRVTAVTLIDIVLGFGSRFTPPFAVEPLSWTWNVKLAYAMPLA